MLFLGYSLTILSNFLFSYLIKIGMISSLEQEIKVCYQEEAKIQSNVDAVQEQVTICRNYVDKMHKISIRKLEEDSNSPLLNFR